MNKSIQKVLFETEYQGEKREHASCELLGDIKLQLTAIIVLLILHLFL